MEYISVLNNYLEYSLDDNYTVINVFFQSISMHATVFHAVFHLNVTSRILYLVSSAVPSFV